MDATEIARLREIAASATHCDWVQSGDAKIKAAFYAQDVAYVVAFPPSVALALLDALEQAQKERDEARALANLSTAQKDAKAARALLDWAVQLFEVGPPVTNPSTAFACKHLAGKVRARIEAMKPEETKHEG